MNANPRTDGRTDLRTTDAHGSWRDVYAALECPPPDADDDAPEIHGVCDDCRADLLFEGGGSE